MSATTGESDDGVEMMKIRSNSDNLSSNQSCHSADESSLVSIKAGCFQPDPGSAAGKRWQMFQMLLFPLIPIVALIFQNSILLSDAVNALHLAQEINGQVCYFATQL